MNIHQQRMIEGLERLRKAIEEMSAEEVARLFEESKVTEEQAKQFAPLERMLMGDGRGLAASRSKE